MLYNKRTQEEIDKIKDELELSLSCIVSELLYDYGSESVNDYNFITHENRREIVNSIDSLIKTHVNAAIKEYSRNNRCY